MARFPQITPKRPKFNIQQVSLEVVYDNKKIIERLA